MRGMPCEIPRIDVSVARGERDYRGESARLSRLLPCIDHHEDLERFDYSC